MTGTSGTYRTSLATALANERTTVQRQRFVLWLTFTDNTIYRRPTFVTEQQNSLSGPIRSQDELNYAYKKEPCRLLLSAKTPLGWGCPIEPLSNCKRRESLRLMTSLNFVRRRSRRWLKTYVSQEDESQTLIRTRPKVLRVLCSQSLQNFFDTTKRLDALRQVNCSGHFKGKCREVQGDSRLSPPQNLQPPPPLQT
jgi:uncharacterized protein VirK/YbjX